MLVLTLDALSVQLDRMPAGDRPRQLPQIGELSYNDGGTPVINGQTYEAKHIWVVTCYMSRPNRRLLSALYEKAEFNRRTTGADYQITIDDTTEEIQEPTPRTRGIVTGTDEISVAGGMVSYFARFKGVMKSRPQFAELQGFYSDGVTKDIWDLATIQLFESDKLLA